jgi:hypothetical protein
MQSALNSNPVVTQADLPTGALSATITYGQQQQDSAIISALTALPQMFYSGFVNMLLNDDPNGALEIAGSLALAVGPQAVAGALAPTTLYHFTTAEGAAAIGASGAINGNAGLFGYGVYGSAWNSQTAAYLMGAASTEASVPFSTGLGTIVPSAWGPIVIPGAYRVIGPPAIFGGVVRLQGNERSLR